jgi:hypothetical protein
MCRVVLPPGMNRISVNKIQGDPKVSVCTWRLQHRKLQVMFKVFPSRLQTFIDTPNCILENRVQYSTPSVIPNFNYVIMVSYCNCLKYLCVFFFCIVIIGCTETFWSSCILYHLSYHIPTPCQLPRCVVRRKVADSAQVRVASTTSNLRIKAVFTFEMTVNFYQNARCQFLRDGIKFLEMVGLRSFADSSGGELTSVMEVPREGNWKRANSKACSLQQQ